MLLVGFAMAANYDIKFENTIAKDAPAFLVDPTKGLEAQSSVHKQLVTLRGGHTNALGRAVAGAQASGAGSGSESRTASAGARSEPHLHLPVLGPAPEFIGTQRWFNTPGGRPISLASLRGKVVVVDFWTYSCINCIRTLPYVKSWYAAYHPLGLEVIGVHTPEFSFEHVAGNVASAIQDDGIRYPVVQDNEAATFDAYGNEYWPAEYFIDARGNVRHAHFGEGDYAGDERVIRSLLAEAGHATASRASARGVIAASADVTPESYLGANRARRFANGTIVDSLHDFGAGPATGPEQLAYSGRWDIGHESATARGGSLSLNFNAKHVYLVMGGSGRHSVRVLLDGRPIPASDAGADVSDGSVTTTNERLYTLVSLPNKQRHVLTLEPQDGTRLYDFTFG
jgi:thiol-disulfide isomerase/thioredoxin